MLKLQLWMAAICLVPMIAQSSAPPAAPDPWAPMRPLVGTWHGTNAGQPGDGSSERTYEFEFGGTFLVARNRAVYPPQAKNPKGEVHQDIGFFSYDKTRRKLLLRQFHSEGFVNQYVGEPGTDGKTIVFETETIENIPTGWRARETYRFVGPDDVAEVFELAAPGKGFETYSECRLHRVAKRPPGRD